VWLAILLAIVISFIGGAVIERVIIRPVERSSPLVIVIVTIGMFLAINSLTQLQFGSGQQALPSFYPQHTWRPGGNRNPLQRIAMTVARRQLARMGSPAAASAKKPR